MANWSPYAQLQRLLRRFRSSNKPAMAESLNAQLFPDGDLQRVFRLIDYLSTNPADLDALTTFILDPVVMTSQGSRDAVLSRIANYLFLQTEADRRVQEGYRTNPNLYVQTMFRHILMLVPLHAQQFPVFIPRILGYKRVFAFAFKICWQIVPPISNGCLILISVSSENDI